MKTKSLFILMLASLMPLAATAQITTPITAPSELVGVRYSTPLAAASTASFAVGLSLDLGLTYVNTARVTDKISITGKIRPEAAHIGNTGDLFVVDYTNGAWTMRNREGIYVPWNFNIPDLVPYKEATTLSADMSVDVYTGALGTSGIHAIFLGYKPAGGSLYYTPVAKVYIFTQMGTTDQAYNMFVSNISPNIIQSRCVLCHVNGGIAQAAGAYHIFKTPLALPASLEANFKTFQNLISLRGSAYILSKVSGGNGHGGGVQLTASSVDYKSLSTFLDVASQDLPPVTTTPPDTGGNDPYNPYADNPYGY